MCGRAVFDFRHHLRCDVVFTGIVNTWYLAGSVPALTETDYGHLLLVKIALFLVMIAVAAVNRLWLTPRLLPSVQTPGVARTALRQAAPQHFDEIAAGAIIIGIVAVLGHDAAGPAWHLTRASGRIIPIDGTAGSVHADIAPFREPEDRQKRCARCCLFPPTVQRNSKRR